MPPQQVIQLAGRDKNAKKEGRGVPAEIWHHQSSRSRCEYEFVTPQPIISHPFLRLDENPHYFQEPSAMVGPYRVPFYRATGSKLSIEPPQAIIRATKSRKSVGGVPWVLFPGPTPYACTSLRNPGPKKRRSGSVAITYQLISFAIYFQFVFLSVSTLLYFSAGSPLETHLLPGVDLTKIFF